MEMTADAKRATHYHRTMLYKGKEHCVIKRAAVIATKYGRDKICRNDMEAAFAQLGGKLLGVYPSAGG